jgi:hypothetical protein
MSARHAVESQPDMRGIRARLGVEYAWVFAAYNLIRIGGLEGWWSPAPT